MGRKVTPAKQLRSERFEMRIKPSVRTNLDAVAAHTRRTLSSLLDEAFEDILKKHPVSASK